MVALTSDMLSLLISLTELRSQASTRQSIIILFLIKKEVRKPKRNSLMYFIGALKSQSVVKIKDQMVTKTL